MTISDIMATALQTANKRGKYNKIYTPEHYHALIHAEVSEATQETICGMLPIYQECVYGQNGDCYIDAECDTPEAECWIKPESKKWSNDKKPLGEVVELADVIIMICSYAARFNLPLEEAIELKMKYDSKRSC